MGRLISNKEFIQKSIEKWGNRYDYSLCKYNGSMKPVTLICNICKQITNREANTHLRRKWNGCKCDIKKATNRLTKSEFIKRSNKKHNNKYSYSKVKYVHSRKTVIITCPIHGNFLQTPASHMNGCGCQKCGKEKSITVNIGRKRGWNSNSGWCWKSYAKFCKEFNIKYSHCYIAKFSKDKEEFIKIGITYKSLENRFVKNPYNIKLISKITGKPCEIFKLEQKLHRLFKKYKYRPKIEFQGYTECFSKDILKDNKLQLFFT